MHPNPLFELAVKGRADLLAYGKVMQHAERLGYIAGRYQTPCGAWAHSELKGWY